MIDAYSPVPAYQQLAEILAGQIERGDLAPGTQVPSESALMQTYGLARGTVRHAVEVLRDRGLVVTVPRGTFVKPK